jgi:DNA-binding transcriptional regulator YiaG
MSYKVTFSAISHEDVSKLIGATERSKGIKLIQVTNGVNLKSEEPPRHKAKKFLTPTEVKQIEKLTETIDYDVLARRFDVSKATIKKIASGAHVHQQA